MFSTKVLKTSLEKKEVWRFFFNIRLNTDAAYMDFESSFLGKNLLNRYSGHDLVILTLYKLRLFTKSGLKND